MDIVKRYLGQVRRSYKSFQRKVGTSVPWYEFDVADSTMNDVYDESPEALWHTGFVLPVMSVVRDEDRETAREEGLYTGGTLHLTIGLEQAVRAGMTDPRDSRRHLRDRFLWDGQYWSVNSFQISGRLIQEEVIIGVDAQRIATEELVNQSHFPPA